MQSLQGKIAGPFVVTRDVEIQGTIEGDAVLRPNMTLRLRGAITGSLTVEKGATAIIYGTIGGRIRKTGGTVVIVHPDREKAAEP